MYPLKYTQFCFTLSCCGYITIHSISIGSIYQYSSGLLWWRWGSDNSHSARKVTLDDIGKISNYQTIKEHDKPVKVKIFLAIYYIYWLLCDAVQFNMKILHIAAVNYHTGTILNAKLHFHPYKFAWLRAFTLYVLNFSEGTKTYIYILCHSSTLVWHRYLKFFLMWDQGIYILDSQYYGCCCPGA